jgi:hypothetical protein
LNNRIDYSQKSQNGFASYLKLYNSVQLGSISHNTRDIAKNTAEMKLGVERTAQGIESLGATISYGMMAQLCQIEAQNRTLSSQLHQLESIDDALHNPDAVRAKEWFSKGEDLMAKGLLDLALNAFIKSQEIFDTNYLTHLYIGKLYLFGINNDLDIIDINKSIQNLWIAARMAKAETKKNAIVQKSCAECYFYLSIANHIAGNEEYRLNHIQEAQVFYESSYVNIQFSLEYNPLCSEAIYLECKLMLLLNRIDEAKKRIQHFVSKNQEYLQKMKNDSDFDSIADFLRGDIIRSSSSQQIYSAIESYVKNICNSLDLDCEDYKMLKQAKGLDFPGKLRLIEQAIGSLSSNKNGLLVKIQGANYYIPNNTLQMNRINGETIITWTDGRLGSKELKIGEISLIKYVELNAIGIRKILFDSDCKKRIRQLFEFYNIIDEKLYLNSEQMQISYLDIHSGDTMLSTIKPVTLNLTSEKITFSFFDKDKTNRTTIDLIDLIEIKL